MCGRGHLASASTDVASASEYAGISRQASAFASAHAVNGVRGTDVASAYW